MLVPHILITCKVTPVFETTHALKSSILSDFVILLKIPVLSFRPEDKVWSGEICLNYPADPSTTLGMT